MASDNKKGNQELEHVAQDIQRQVLKKYSSDLNYRQFDRGFWKKVILILAVCLSLFHLYTAGFGQLMAIKQRAVHIGLIMILVFLLYPLSKKRLKDNPSGGPSFLDLLLALLTIATIGYIYLYFDSITMRMGIANQIDMMMGTIFMFLVLEAARRTLGWVLPILGIVFTLYAMYGEWIPGPFGHRDFSYRRIIEQMYISTEGIFGIALGVSATYIFLFVLFGAIMNKTGMGSLIKNTALAIAGRRPGGPAKVAMVGSSVMGTINGAAVANVVTTGAFTIPLMKRIGYKPVFAASVEAVASAGGQIMPPVMGAAAFVLAELTGIPYATVMIAAIVPALLYYIATWTMIDREARRLNLRGLTKEETPIFIEVFKKRGHMVIPLFVVIGFLLNGYSPLYAAFFGILSTWFVSSFRTETRMSGRDFLDSLEQGGKTALSVGMACAVVGFIVGSVSLTSAGVAFTDSILKITDGALFFTLLLTMVACIIMGMGLPTTAAYIMVATIAVPALINLGIHPLPANLFVFYFAILSTLTPPVAIAAYAAAGMAQASPFKVGWTSLRLAIAGFIIPFIFVYHPQILLLEGGLFETISSIGAAIVGVIFLGIGVIGYYHTHCYWYERLFILVSGLIMIVPDLLTDLVGLALGLGIYFLQRRRVAQKKKVLGSGELTM